VGRAQRPVDAHRLVYDGKQWTPDTANDWANGKTLVYPNGGGVPDSEGVTLAAGDANGIYVSVEHDDSGGNGNTSRPGVLRDEVTAPGATLTATDDFNLTADLPGLGKNAGLEAVTWVPDALLVAKGLIDESTGKKYDPSIYANHGQGLFFVGVEQNGEVIAYALNRVAGTYDRVATIASGFPNVMELTYEPDTGQLWAVCDNDCDGRAATLEIAPTGHFEITHVYERPAGMPNINNEGFAIAPNAECVDNLKPVFYADDSNDAGHALRIGAIKCAGREPQTSPEPAPTPIPTPEATVTPQPTPAPAPMADRTAPKLELALKTVRRTGKLAPTVTVDERADLAITVKAGKRTLLTTTRKAVAAGKRTIALKVKTLKRGTRITLTVQARDAAGGKAATRTVSTKVK
jgi:hypothetical protein